MRTLLWMMPLLLLGCDTPAPPAQTPAPAPAPQTAAQPEAPPPAEQKFKQPEPWPRGDCGGLTNVDIMPVVERPAVEGVDRFAFSPDPEALVYAVDWRGDLNGDGVADVIGKRLNDRGIEVHTVLVGCEEGFALAFAGPAKAVTVLDTTTKVGQTDWLDVDVIAGAQKTPVRYAFNGTRYAVP